MTTTRRDILRLSTAATAVMALPAIATAAAAEPLLILEAQAKEALEKWADHHCHVEDMRIDLGPMFRKPCIRDAPPAVQAVFSYTDKFDHPRTPGAVRTYLTNALWFLEPQGGESPRPEYRRRQAEVIAAVRWWESECGRRADVIAASGFREAEVATAAAYREVERLEHLMLTTPPRSVSGILVLLRRSAHAADITVAADLAARNGDELETDAQYLLLAMAHLEAFAGANV
jgi:hypothetical protein